jgi:hypothetical protein
MLAVARVDLVVSTVSMARLPCVGAMTRDIVVILGS